MTQDWQPETKLAKAVYTAGFRYDPDQDIIFSRMDAWQRKFGYAYAYDLAAPVTISAVIDCEPIFFRYDQKDWMIELWKGQYGLETGAEIGVYVSDDTKRVLDATIGKRPGDDYNSQFFECAEDGERLEMSFELERDGRPLFARGPELHWWLTGFKWGVLSSPEQLVMKLRVTLSTTEMREVFVDAIEGHPFRDISVDGQTVAFTFDQATPPQPRRDPRCAHFVELAQSNNSQIVHRYGQLDLEDSDPNGIRDEIAGDVLDYFNCCSPTGFGDRLADALQTTGYQATDVGQALQEVFRTSAEDAAQVLHQAGYDARQVAETLRNVFKQGSEQAAKILVNIRAEFDEARDALDAVFDDGKEAITNLLRRLF